MAPAGKVPLLLRNAAYVRERDIRVLDIQTAPKAANSAQLRHHRRYRMALVRFRTGNAAPEDFRTLEDVLETLTEES